MVKLLIINKTINFNECWYEVNEIFVKIENLQETLFTWQSIKLKIRENYITFIIKYPEKFTYKVLSNLVRDCGEGQTDERADGQTDGQTERRLYARPLESIIMSDNNELHID